jgi:hypothetical protein
VPQRYQQPGNAVVTRLTCGFAPDDRREGYRDFFVGNAFVDVAVDVAVDVGGGWWPPWHAPQVLFML